MLRRSVLRMTWAQYGMFALVAAALAATELSTLALLLATLLRRVLALLGTGSVGIDRRHHRLDWLDRD